LRRNCDLWFNLIRYSTCCKVIALKLEQAFVWTFNSRKPPPLPYARACLASLLVSEFTSPPFPVSQLIIADLAELVLPDDPVLDPANEYIELPTDPRHVMYSIVNDFGMKAMKVRISIILVESHLI
jgi:hypothetical protein